jgi:lysophospholipase L1-like esterase
MDTGDIFATALKEGKNPYRDNIHPNETGQALLADMIENAIVE